MHGVCPEGEAEGFHNQQINVDLSARLYVCIIVLQKRHSRGMY